MIYKIKTEDTTHYVGAFEILAVQPPEKEMRIGSCGPTGCWFVRVICKGGRWFDVEQWSNDTLPCQSICDAYTTLVSAILINYGVKEIKITNE